MKLSQANGCILNFVEDISPDKMKKEFSIFWKMTRQKENRQSCLVCGKGGQNCWLHIRQPVNTHELKVISRHP